MFDRMRLRLGLCLMVVTVVSGTLAGCADWPDLDDPTTRDALVAPPPRIGPLPALLDTVDGDAAALQAETEVLQGRADALRARAARIAAQD